VRNSAEDSSPVGTPRDWPCLDGSGARLRSQGVCQGRPRRRLVGSAGVGKTVWPREAIGRAEESGWPTRGSRHSGQASIPFGPFAHFFRSSSFHESAGYSSASSLTRFEPCPRTPPRIGDRRRAPARRSLGCPLDQASAPDGTFFVLATARAGERATPDSVRVSGRTQGQSDRVQALPEILMGQLSSQALDGQVDGSRRWPGCGRPSRVMCFRELILGAGRPTPSGCRGVWSWTGPMVVSRVAGVLDARSEASSGSGSLVEVLAYADRLR